MQMRRTMSYMYGILEAASSAILTSTLLRLRGGRRGARVRGEGGKGGGAVTYIM